MFCKNERWYVIKDSTAKQTEPIVIFNTDVSSTVFEAPSNYGIHQPGVVVSFCLRRIQYDVTTVIRGGKRVIYQIHMSQTPIALSIFMPAPEDDEK